MPTFRIYAAGVLAEPPPDPETIPSEDAIEAICCSWKRMRDSSEGLATRKRPEQCFGKVSRRMDSPVWRDDVCRRQPSGRIEVGEEYVALLALNRDRPHAPGSVPAEHLVDGPSAEAAVFVVKQSDLIHALLSPQTRDEIHGERRNRNAPRPG